MTATTDTALHRAAPGARPAAPVRIVHLGLGNFFRAHQAWYTDRAPDAADWGIAAFTGRSAGLAETLRAQDGLYTLITKDPGGDRAEPVASLSQAHPATDLATLRALLADPAVAVVTLTVTEAGYCRGADGGLDRDRADIAADLTEVRTGGDALTTVPARLVAGLLARYRAGGAPIAVVSCDNLPGNGAVTRRVVRDAAAVAAPELLPWIDEHVSFVDTMVDRITPRPTPEDAAAAPGDRAPVVTEPFSEWVLSGRFPAGRPAWEAAGARFVDDVTAFEERKLLLLNGGHSLLAYAGPLRGHTTVAAAIADPVCQGWVEQWWNVASRHLRVPESEIDDYRANLLMRFANPAIRHQLTQIAADGSQKLPVRVLPVLRAERARGSLPTPAARILGAWLLHLRGHGAPVSDPAAEELTAAAAGAVRDAATRVLARLAPDLAGDAELVDAITAEAEGLLA